MVDVQAVEIWYRYEDVRYAPSVDEFDRPLGKGTLEVHLREFHVVKRTSKGVWLSYGGICKPRFVLRDAYRRYACPTIEEAKVSFVARKTRQAKIYRSRMERALEAIRKMEGKDIFACAPPT